MASYIEFTTVHNENTLGNPIHDLLPQKHYEDIVGIRVDEKLIEFNDPSILERMGRYLLESHRISDRRIANNCVTFGALMNSVELRDSKHNPFEHFDADVTVDPIAGDAVNNSPLVLVRKFHGGLLIPRHVVVPAHLTVKENYLHKLGDDGPLCMSGLSDALRIMHCTSAHPAPM